MRNRIAVPAIDHFDDDLLKAFMGEEVAKTKTDLDPILLGLTFRYRPHNAQAHGRVLSGGGFAVLAGSTAIRESSATKKRDRAQRDGLIRDGILAADSDPDLLRFTSDHKFTSPSRAAGVVKDGNASGPQLWIDVESGRSLKDFLSSSS